MKKLLLATNVVFIIAAIFFACNPQPKEPDATTTETVPCEHCQDYSKSEFEGVPAGLAFSMISRYKANHWNNYRIAGAGKPTDARSVWFSLDTLKKFIWNLEQEVCNKKCADKKTLGLRFYYAEYPQQPVWDKLDPLDTDPVISKDEEDHRLLYQGLHTVVITPTYWSEASKLNVDFDPRYVDENCKPKTLQDVMRELNVMFDTTSHSMVALTSGQPAFVLSPDIRTSAKNKGSLIPPPPPIVGGIVAGELNGAVVLDMIENKFRTY